MSRNDSILAELNSVISCSGCAPVFIAFGRGSVLQLKDTEGRDRIVLRVAPDGTPKLQFLDAAGKVVSELPQSAAPAASHP